LSQLKTVFEKHLGGISAIRFGGEYWYSNVDTKYRTSVFYNNTTVDNLISLFGESDIYVTNGLAAKIGARFEHSSLLNQSNIAPRVSLAYKTG
ncbi:hypothetical protein ABTM06_19530, partial [Acinetobacter baumannii]